jgi:hypothetical protein
MTFKPKARTIYDWTDLLFLGEEMGYGWNRTHDLMDFCNARIWNDSTHGVFLEEIEDIGNEDAIKIMREFFKRVGNPELVEFAA